MRTVNQDHGSALRFGVAAVSVIAAVAILWTAGLPDRATVNAITVQSDAGTPVAPESGALAPNFTATTTANIPIALRDLRGSPVILNFWATWCGPCLSEMPALQAAYKAHHDQGLRILAIDSSEPTSDVLAWKSQLGLTYDTIIDDSTLSDLYRLRGLPTTFFIGRDGIVQDIVYGPLTDQALDTALKRLMQ